MTFRRRLGWTARHPPRSSGAAVRSACGSHPVLSRRPARGRLLDGPSGFGPLSNAGRPIRLRPRRPSTQSQKSHASSRPISRSRMTSDSWTMIPRLTRPAAAQPQQHGRVPVNPGDTLDVAQGTDFDQKAKGGPLPVRRKSVHDRPLLTRGGVAQNGSAGSHSSYPPECDCAPGSVPPGPGVFGFWDHPNNRNDCISGIYTLNVRGLIRMFFVNSIPA
jgi:hypothetical protein